MTQLFIPQSPSKKQTLPQKPQNDTADLIQQILPKEKKYHKVSVQRMALLVVLPESGSMPIVGGGLSDTLPMLSRLGSTSMVMMFYNCFPFAVLSIFYKGCL